MKKRAFTLIELLVVIAIIALLLSIIMPSLSRVKAQATRLICATRMKQIHLAAVLYAADDAKGRLPQGGRHHGNVDDDDGIGMEACNYFKLSNYIAAIPGMPTSRTAVAAMPTSELRRLAKACVEDGGGEIFVCPSIQKGNKAMYNDKLFGEKRRMKTVYFCTFDTVNNNYYTRLGYCYLAGFETDKWNFDQLGAVSRGFARPWKSPMVSSDGGTCVLATDRARHIPAGVVYVNKDFLANPHSARGYKLISPVGAGFDYKTADGGTNVLTLDGAVEFQRFSQTYPRQMFNRSTGGLHHEDYTFFK